MDGGTKNGGDEPEGGHSSHPGNTPSRTLELAPPQTFSENGGARPKMRIPPGQLLTNSASGDRDSLDGDAEEIRGLEDGARGGRTSPEEGGGDGPRRAPAGGSQDVRQMAQTEGVNKNRLENAHLTSDDDFYEDDRDLWYAENRARDGGTLPKRLKLEAQRKNMGTNNKLYTPQPTVKENRYPYNVYPPPTTTGWLCTPHTTRVPGSWATIWLPHGDPTTGLYHAHTNVAPTKLWVHATYIYATPNGHAVFCATTICPRGKRRSRGGTPTNGGYNKQSNSGWTPYRDGIWRP